MEIKHILFESGVEQTFKLVVPAGNFAGEYVIKTPKGWNDIDSIVKVNPDRFNVEEFIIGSNEKLTFSEFTDKKTYDLIRGVYREQRGDGRIIFKWIAKKAGVEYDLLSEAFELNLNKYKNSRDKTMGKIETELKLNEDQNKLFSRYDTTVNLFETKDLDEKPITPVEKFEVGFKKNNSTLRNFYIYDVSQEGRIPPIYTEAQGTVFFAFQRTEDYQFGDNTNQRAGNVSHIDHQGRGYQQYLGPFVYTVNTMAIKVRISNMLFYPKENCALYAVFYSDNFERKVPLAYSSYVGDHFELRIDDATFSTESTQQNFTLNSGQSLTFRVESTEDSFLNALDVKNDNMTIEITSEIETPLVHTSSIRLLSAIDQLAKNYTSGGISAESNILGQGGAFYNTSISTGVYLRGLPAVYGGQKVKTSLNALLDEGAFKLMALGFDLLGNKMVVEDVGYFFKDVLCYDLSERQYLTDSYSLENDAEVSFNALTFGTKKYSTNQKFDIQNFNTVVEVSTPIKTNKKKFDKQTDLIIDADKIKELTDDGSNATNDSDDDLVLIDMVAMDNYPDSGVFESCQHLSDNGTLVLKCFSPSFDASMIKPGQQITIPEGLNAGTHTVVSISGSDMRLGSSAVNIGTADTKIKYTISTLVKNRTNEGFDGIGETIRNATSTTNIRHNPKYQLARWWPYFGSGFRAKGNDEILKVTSYKNNSAAKMTISTPDMANELQGEVVVGTSETLGRMRNHRQTFFNGDVITVAYSKVTFEEFFMIFNNWKFGIDGDRNKSRGFITCNTPDGIFEVYPDGDQPFTHSKKTNTLTISGKVRGKSVINPVLFSAVQVDSDTVTMVWDYATDFVNPEIKIQYSFDGSYWENAGAVTNVKTTTITNPLFSQIMTGTMVYFRIVVSSADYYNKVSNTLPVSWQFNDWVIQEYAKNENTQCGNSYMTLLIRGTVDLEIKWTYTDTPGGGNYSVMDNNDNSVVASYSSAYGIDGYDEQITTHSLSNQNKSFRIQLKNSDKNFFGQVLNCSSGNMLEQVYAGLTIEAKDLSTGNITTFQLNADTLKKYRQRPQNPTGPTTDPEIL